MRPDRFTRAPGTLRRKGVHLDNLVLVPASLLPVKAYWQRIANALPPGDMLIVAPRWDKQRRVVASVARRLRERGKRVAVVDPKRHQRVLPS